MLDVMFRPWLIRAAMPPGPYCAWRGPSLLVVDEQGNASPEKLTGLFFRETRYLATRTAVERRVAVLTVTG
jgi:hypothetical protein